MKEDLTKIIKYHGLRNQLKYIHSEYYELDEAILDYENRNGDKSCIIGELADVINMLEQIQLYYGISDEELNDMKIFKIKRHLEEIKL